MKECLDGCGALSCLAAGEGDPAGFWFVPGRRTPRPLMTALGSGIVGGRTTSDLVLSWRSLSDPTVFTDTSPQSAAIPLAIAPTAAITTTASAS
jgi:hypothetical protein